MQVFITFDFQKVLIDQINDPDINFFNDKSGAGDSLDFSSGEFNSLSEKILKNWLSILLINIMRLNKNYGKLRKYLSLVKRDFIVMGLTDMWCNDNKAAQHLLL